MDCRFLALRDWRGYAFLGVSAFALTGTLVADARAGVIQTVGTAVAPGIFGTPAATSDRDEIFAQSSGGITSNIGASVGGSTAGYSADASAGVFGQVGLQAQTAGAVNNGGTLSTEVFIASDEYVNLLGGPVNVTSNFIIDGGSIADLQSANLTVTFTLEVGAQNLGQVGSESDPVDMEFAGRQTAGFGGAGGFFPGFEGGRYTATYSTDASGVATFSDIVEGGLDLNAALVSGLGNVDVEIPFSLQSLDLGTLLPGERLLLAYRASFDITVGGFTEGLSAEFSDPFSVNESIRTSLTFAPVTEVAEAGSLPVLAAGLLAFARLPRRGRRGVRTEAA